MFSHSSGYLLNLSVNNWQMDNDVSWGRDTDFTASTNIYFIFYILYFIFMVIYQI
jgi:hypothetical protein